MRTLTILLSCVAATGLGTATSHAQPNPGSSSYHATITAGHGRLGVEVLELSPALRTHLGGTADGGVLIDNLRKDSPAAKAGVAIGDLVISIDGHPTATGRAMLGVLGDRKKGDAVTIGVVRDHRSLELKATLADDAPMNLPSDEAFPDLDRSFQMFDSGDLRRQLDEMRHRMDQLEQQVHKQPHA